MPTINLGRVGFVNKGVWSISTAYKINDVVDHANGTYAALQANIGQTPTLGGNAFWQEWVSNDTVMLTGDQSVGGIKTFTANYIGTSNGNITPFGKNYIINGNFDTWQRATSFTVGVTATYTADRWICANGGGTFGVYQGGTSNAKYALALEQQTSPSTYWYLATRLESLSTVKLQNKPITLSFRLYNNKGSSKSITVNFNTPTVSDTFSTKTNVSSQTITHTGNSSYQDFTVTVPNVGTNVDKGIEIEFTSTSMNVGEAIGLSAVKLEEGSVATPWTPYEGEFGGEVQACQRYYWRIPSGYLRIYGYGSAGNAFVFNFKLPVTMRTTPTLDFNSATTTNCSAGAGAATAEFLTISPTITTTGTFILAYSGVAQYASAEL